MLFTPTSRFHRFVAVCCGLFQLGIVANAQSCPAGMYEPPVAIPLPDANSAVCSATVVMPTTCPLPSQPSFCSTTGWYMSQSQLWTNIGRCNNACINEPTCAASRYLPGCGGSCDGWCQWCRAGLSISTPNRRRYNAVPLYKKNCENCPAGRYSTTVGATDISSCLPCDIGKGSPAGAGDIILASDDLITCTVFSCFHFVEPASHM